MKLEIIMEIDTKECRWCSSAVLTEISGGRGTLTKVSENNDIYDTFYNKSMLMLGDKPLIQCEVPMCGTCSAMLARGCGIEKANSPELAEIRDRINAPFIDLTTSIENIKPILGLLDDGYYVIADAVLYPTDGEDHFFTNVIDKLHPMDAAANYIYSFDFYSGTDGFPSFLYPTQSNSCLNTERAKHYLDVIDKDNAPRAIAYYHYGFLCALLDGHHKAYAAAMKGEMLKTIVIIPVTAYRSSKKDGQTVKDRVCFADIVIPLDDKVKYRPFKPFVKDMGRFKEYVNEPVPENKLMTYLYPDVTELCNFYSSVNDKAKINDELIEKSISSDSEADEYYLRYVMRYLSKTDIDRAVIIAAKIIHSENSGYYKKKMAMQFLVKHKCPESEMIVTDYLIDHDPDVNDPIYRLADSYWE